MPYVITISIFLMLAAAGLSAGGLWLLAGTGWAMMCGAAWCFAVGYVLARGVITNG